MRINEMKLDNNLMSLLTELFSIKGAKEIFAKHNVEMVTEQIEKEGLTNFIKQAKELFGTSKTVKEYNQSVQFLDLQINTNKSALEKAEGFMKTMIEGMISGFENTKNLAIQNFSPMFREELKGLLHNIVNENDKENIKEMIDEYDITKLDEMLGAIKSIENSINSRYCETERKVDKTVTNDIEENKQEVKAVEVEQNSLFDETIKNENKTEDKSVVEKSKKSKKKVEKIEESVEDDIEIDGLDLDFAETEKNETTETDNSFNQDDPFDDEEFSKFLDEDDGLFDNSDDGVELDF